MQFSKGKLLSTILVHNSIPVATEAAGNIRANQEARIPGNGWQNVRTRYILGNQMNQNKSKIGCLERT